MLYTIQGKVLIVESYIRKFRYEATGDEFGQTCVLQYVGFLFEHSNFITRGRSVLCTDVEVLQRALQFLRLYAQILASFRHISFHLYVLDLPLGGLYSVLTCQPLSIL